MARACDLAETHDLVVPNLSFSGFQSLEAQMQTFKGGHLKHYANT